MKEDTSTGSVSPDQINPLLGAELVLPSDIEFTAEDIFNLPSPHITPQHMLMLKERIQQAYAEGVAGVVITHGTDTLEETAFFLDVTIGNLLPIVVTGAMRSSNELGSDGLYNFESAIRVAAADASQGKGVLVVMNDEIHTAHFVTKTHTTNVATFRTPTFGPIGMLTKQHVRFVQQPQKTTHLDVRTINGLVPIVKAYAGMNAQFIEVLSEAGMDGLVIEGLGAGNLPPQTIPALKNLMVKNIPVVLVSRCFNGVAEPIYDYEGGGKQLEKMGIIFCTGINSQKARLKLLIALNSSLDDISQRQFLQE